MLDWLAAGILFVVGVGMLAEWLAGAQVMDMHAVGLSIAALAGAGVVLLPLGMMAWYWWRERGG